LHEKNGLFPYLKSGGHGGLAGKPVVDMVGRAKNGGQTGLGLVNWSCGGCPPWPP